jgi:Protein of unknown function (DUF3396)
MTKIIDLANELTLRAGDSIYLQPCLDIVLYWAGTPFERADGIVSFYEKSLELIGNDLRFFKTETMGAAKPLKKDTLGLVSFWFRETDSRRDIYTLTLESGASHDEPSDRAFSLNVIPGRGFVRLVLPVAFVAESPAAFLNLATALSETLPYDFGQAGLSVNWKRRGGFGDEAMLGMTMMASRYPGFDMSDPSSTMFVVTKGIKCVNWLTFLSRGYVDRLGGVDQLLKNAQPAVGVRSLAKGVAVQAGVAPEPGDSNRLDMLPAYHEAGKLLAPIRSREHPALFGPDGFADNEITNKWLARFDR